MMTARVTPIGPRRDPIPPLVSEKVIQFLNSGQTGVIELQITNGRIRGFKITESVRFDSAPDVDRNGHRQQD